MWGFHACTGGQGRPRLPCAFICGKLLDSAYAAARKQQHVPEKRWSKWLWWIIRIVGDMDAAVLTSFLCSLFFWRLIWLIYDQFCVQFFCEVAVRTLVTVSRSCCNVTMLHISNLRWTSLLSLALFANTRQQQFVLYDFARTLCQLSSDDLMMKLRLKRFRFQPFFVSFSNYCKEENVDDTIKKSVFERNSSQFCVLGASALKAILPSATDTSRSLYWCSVSATEK